jgi:hypothetical protein
METGRASHTNSTNDKIGAGVAIGIAALDVVLTPIFVGSLMKIPAVAAAKTGTDLGVKTLFTQTGKVAATAAVKRVSATVAVRTVGVGLSDTVANCFVPAKTREKNE